MDNRIIILLLVTLTLITGCYLPISGKVIDAETKQPIEGAIVLVEWTKTIGYGLTRTESYKVAETLSDKDGKFHLPGCYSPFVNLPDVAIYKKDYVTWSSRNIFPSIQTRNDYQWGSGGVYMLEKFREVYSYIEHQGFTSAAVNSTIGWENKKQFLRIFYDSEERDVIREQEERDKKAKKGYVR